MNKIVWTDQTLMPSGKYKGVALANIPANWFLWIKNTYGIQKDSPLDVYIIENYALLRQQAEQEEKDYKRNYRNNAR